ncbi:Gfo/Idh/MocA family protein [Haloferula chungangensis]|uniref:Gfo/Idh/MocA family protein n=1 Tax=Haloferula chungangensis TaxID=1048331 RepID=A0ABW2L4C1_9BACT
MHQITRRSFISRAALASGVTFLAPHALASGSNTELRIAVIGLRSRGKELLSLVLKGTNARLVAVCDVDPAILREHVDKLAKKNVKVAAYSDYRTLCEAKDIDAIAIATPNHTHVLISVTAAANGKHVYVEKPVSHNVQEGIQLADAQKAFGVIIQHGFQRRTETAWQDAFEWIGEGHLGELKLARAICYKPRPSIGKVRGPQLAPEGLDYDLWCGPRQRTPILRKQFHYDWHWQSSWGNGEIGNQGAHQLDVCRWALGDPQDMPRSVFSCGNRLGYLDDGYWPNTQLASFDYEKAPVLIEVRGLPAREMNFKAGMDQFRGESVGNIIEYEGGALIGGHYANCHVVDESGKKLKEFSGPSTPIQTWIDSIHSGKQSSSLSARNGHLSSSLSHLANISWQLGTTASKLDGSEPPAISEAFGRMTRHLEANGVDLNKTPLKIGAKLSPNATGSAFTGEFKPIADPYLMEQNREGFELPI